MKTQGGGRLFETATPVTETTSLGFLFFDSYTAIWVFILISVFVAAGAGRAAESDSCAACHRSLPDKLGAPVAAMEKDVHSSYGLSCANCHGGDPTDPGLTAMAPEKGFRPAPTPQEIPHFCGRCHSNESYMGNFNLKLPTDQEAQYSTSIHGKRLTKGDGKVATCVSCHGVHGILAVDQTQSPVYPTNVARTCARCHADAAYMAGYNIPTDQFAQYQKSVHGVALLVKRDLTAPTCNDCHGNHGAHPPGAESVAAICGQCHAINRDLFLQSPHKAAFDRVGLPECAACHGMHEVLKTSDEMLGVGDVAICVTCHKPESKGYQTAKAMRERLEDLKAVMGETEKTLDAAERAGAAVGEIRYNFQEAHQALVQARNTIHTFSLEDLEKVVAKGKQDAMATLQAGNDILAELQGRKRMMIVPLLAIGFVMILLYVKIRTLDKM